MKLGIFFVVINAISGFAHEKTEPLAQFSGDGLIKTKADFISLSFTVHSECHEHPSDAQTATDDVVTKINKYLEQFKTATDSHFKILIDGGFTVPFHDGIAPCKNKRKNNFRAIVSYVAIPFKRLRT